MNLNQHFAQLEEHGMSPIGSKFGNPVEKAFAWLKEKGMSPCATSGKEWGIVTTSMAFPDGPFRLYLDYHGNTLVIDVLTYDVVDNGQGESYRVS